MASQDPYEVLGIARDASADEIKSAYRRLARRYHPDVNPNDPAAEEKFKEIGSAYAVLSDPDKRRRFDQTGSTEDQPTDPFFGGGGISDLFDMFFGAQTGGHRTNGRDGDDLRADVELTYVDVVNGAQREIEVDRLGQCDSCRGTGVEGGAAPETCGTCRGQGVVGSVRNTFLGQVRTTTTCPTCHGSGTIIKNPCKECSGRGVTPKHERVHLNIPPGFDDGATMHLPGQGNEGTGAGRPGDLYVILHVKADKRFERRGQTLLSPIEISVTQAILGDRITVPGIDTDLELHIPAGTQPNTQIPIKGAGLPPLHGGRRGDFVAHVIVRIPTKISDAQTKLIQEFAELSGEDLPQGEDKGLFGLFGKKR